MGKISEKYEEQMRRDSPDVAIVFGIIVAFFPLLINTLFSLIFLGFAVGEQGVYESIFVYSSIICNVMAYFALCYNAILILMYRDEAGWIKVVLLEGLNVAVLVSNLICAEEAMRNLRNLHILH